jgi:integrase
VGKTTKSYIVQREINRRSVRVTIARTHEMTVSNARAEASKLMLSMRNGHNPNVGKKPIPAPVVKEAATLQMLLDQHVESLKLKGCEFSSVRYPRSLALHVGDWLPMPVESITRDSVIERHRKVGVNVGKKTSNAVFRTLRALYNQYRIDHPDFNNPVEILSLKKLWFPEKPRDVRIKHHEIKRWLESVQTDVKNPVHRDCMVFLLLNGLRKNEAMNLSWDQVDFEGKTFRITKTKNKKPLELPFTDVTESILQRLWSTRDTGNTLTSPWVFPSKVSETGHLYTVSKSLERITEKTGLTIRLHDLRRTFVSVANGIKIPHYTIKKLVNHSSGGDVTASVYNVMDVDDLREPMQAITDEFKKVMEGALLPRASVVIPLRMVEAS